MMWEKKNRLDDLTKKIKSGLEQIGEKKMLLEGKARTTGNLRTEYEAAKKKLEAAELKYKNAMERVEKEKSKAKQKIQNFSIEPGSSLYNEIKLEEEKIHNQYLKYVISILSSESQEFQSTINSQLQDRGIDIPEPKSEKSDTQSQRSRLSRMSINN